MSGIDKKKELSKGRVDKSSTGKVNKLNISVVDAKKNLNTDGKDKLDISKAEEKEEISGADIEIDKNRANAEKNTGGANTKEKSGIGEVDAEEDTS